MFLESGTIGEKNMAVGFKETSCYFFGDTYRST